MCGVAALLQIKNIPSLPRWPFWAGATPPTHSTSQSPLDPLDVLSVLSQRGPDSSFRHRVSLSNSSNTSQPPTLHLIQTVLSHRGVPPSPILSSSEDALLFNGELYFDKDTQGTTNDTRFLQKLLSDTVLHNDACAASLLDQLDQLRGPWTLIFWHAARRRLYFARDILGRRSLLARVIPGQAFELVSIPPRHNYIGFVEVPPLGLAFAEIREDCSVQFGLVARSCTSLIPHTISQQGTEKPTAGSDTQMYVSFLPSHWLRSINEKEGQSLTMTESAQGFLKCFRRSVRRRLVTNRRYSPGYPRYAVLFSGGIDSLVIAAMIAECLPPPEIVQLINVAFGRDQAAINECPDRKGAVAGLRELQALYPARHFDLCCVDVSSQLADDTLECCIRPLVFPCDHPMDASIGTAIWLAARGKGRSYTDIGMGNDASGNNLHFASAARILFSGLGADELMGGYKGRHRTVFRKEGVQGIKKEMDADLSRLWFRNLGRDDRLIADHGKEGRHPFLDEDVISFVTNLPLVKHVCDLSKPDGIGDKHLLRRAAALLGFSADAVSRAKRAIQFGSRSKQVIERKRPH